MIGLLFASFGVTLLAVSVPMGAVSDRIGRKAPLVGGLVGARRRDAALRVRRLAAVAVRRAPGAGRRRRRHLGRRLRADRRSVRPRGARPRDGLRHVGHERRLHGRAVDRRLAVRGGRHPAAVRFVVGARARRARVGFRADARHAARATRHRAGRRCGR